MTTQEMMQTVSSTGCWKNIAGPCEEPNWIEAYPPETLDPNEHWLFVYEDTEFMPKKFK